MLIKLKFTLGKGKDTLQRLANEWSLATKLIVEFFVESDSKVAILNLPSGC